MYQIQFSKRALKSLEKLDKTTQALIIGWINKNLVGNHTPKLLGKRLRYDLKSYYRYRIGNYRIIVDISDEWLTIITLECGHRKTIYKSKP